MGNERSRIGKVFDIKATPSMHSKERQKVAT
jgi:hypothetical protein